MPCDMWQRASGRRDTCRTHGKPCVHLHAGGLVYGFGSDMCHTHGMHMPCGGEMAQGLAIYMDIQFSSWKCNKKERESKERKEGKKRKERKKRKGKGNRNQHHTGSRTRRQRTQNCATRGRFPPTLVILHLGATYWPNSFSLFQSEFNMCVVWLLLCDGQRPVSWHFGAVQD